MIATVKIVENHPAGAIEASQRAIEFDPHGPDVELFYDNIAVAAFESGRYEMGLDAARRTLRLQTTYIAVEP